MSGASRPDHQSRHGQIARAVRATGGMTMLSRVGGLVRDVVIGRIFGDTVVGSAFAFAFAVPNMFRRLFGEGALAAAFVPEYAEIVREGERRGEAKPREAGELASITLAALALVTVALTVLIEVALLLALLVLPADAERSLSLKLLMVMLPFMPLICCAAVMAGMLQVHSRYAAAASGPLLLNAFIVVTGVYFIFSGQLAGEWAAYAIGVATVLSGVSQVVWFLKLLRPLVSWTGSWGNARARAKAVLTRFVPVAIGLGTLQLNTLLDSLIAMWGVLVGPTMFGRAYPLDDLSNVILALTARFYQFPLGVFGIAVASAIFPLLARFAADPEHFADTLRRGLRLSLLVGVPASVGLILVRDDAIGVLYGHGRTGWSGASLHRAANVLTGFSVGVWAYGLNHVLTRAMYAKKDTITPMRVAIAIVVLNAGLNFTLIWTLREAGLAWATSISAIAQCLVLGVIVRGRVRKEGQVLVDRAMVSGCLRLILSAALMAAAVFGVQRVLPEGSRWSMQMLRLVIAICIGGAAYAGAAWALKCPELRWLLERPKRESGAGGGEAAVDSGE